MQGGEVSVRTLGGLEVTRGELAVSTFGSRRARTVLAILATSERPVHRDVLAKLLWPDDPIEAARPRLRTEIHRLRESLGPLSSIILTDRDAVSIDRSQAAIDIERVVQLIEDAKSADGAGDAALLAAVELFRGSLLPHELDGWCRPRRAQWDDTIRDTIEAAGRRALSQGFPEQSLFLARRGLSMLSDRPGLIGLVMESLVALHDVPEALATYDRYVDRLEAEADLSPDKDLARYAATLRQGYRPVEEEASTVQADLPPRTAKIFGREETLALLQEKLRPSPEEDDAIVTLIGPGGVGKTTVALEVARLLESDYRGRVYFLPLAGIFDMPGMIVAVAKAVGANVSESNEMSAIAARLKAPPSLVVLDNFEQLLPEGSRWVADLSRRLPGTRILVTSRRSIGLSVERRIPLAPLSTASEESPAVSLFIDRARRLVPEYAPKQEEVADIARLATRLEGLPLGLVLAAARVSSFTPGQMLRDLGSLAGLSSSAEDVDERHRSLKLAIEWSLDLLSPEQLTFLQKLTVFPRDWSTEAASQLAGSEAPLILPALADQSLIVMTSTELGPRFRMLQMIREHLLSEHGEVPDGLRQAHATYYSDIVRAAYPNQKADINANVRLLRPEADNIEATLDYLRDRDRERYYQTLIGMTAVWCFQQNERRAADRALEAARETDERGDAVNADLSYCALRLLIIAGRYEEGQERGDVAERLYRAANDRPALLTTLRYKSHLAYYQFDFRQMRADCEVTIPLAQELGDEVTTALSLSDLSLAQANLGDGAGALVSLTECLNIYAGRNDSSRILIIRQGYAAALLSMRRWDEAERVLLDVLEQNGETQHEVIEAQCHTHLTTVCLRTGRIDEAEQHLKIALDPSRPSVHAFLKGVRHYLAVLLWVAKQDRRQTERSIRELFHAWSSVSRGPAILPAVDIVAYALGVFGHIKAGKELLDGSDALRQKLGQDVSPHYSLTHENARALLGPYEPVDPPESCAALCRTAQNAVWFL